MRNLAIMTPSLLYLTPHTVLRAQSEACKPGVLVGAAYKLCLADIGHRAGLSLMNKPQILNTMMVKRVMIDFASESPTCSRVFIRLPSVL
jgi:hypothetical protein